MLQHAKSLTSLDLSSTRITGTGPEQLWLPFNDALVTALRGEGRKPLEELDLSRNRLFDRRVALLLDRMCGRQALVPLRNAPECSIGLPSAPALRCFRLAGNRLTVLSLQAFAKALRVECVVEAKVPSEAEGCGTAESSDGGDSGEDDGASADFTVGCTVAAHLGRRAFVLDLRDNPLGLADLDLTPSRGNFVTQLRHFFKVRGSCKLLVDVAGLCAPEGFDCAPGVAGMARERSLVNTQPAKRHRVS